MFNKVHLNLMYFYFFGGDNMKVKKIFAAVSTAALAAVALTACGKKDICDSVYHGIFLYLSILNMIE